MMVKFNNSWDDLLKEEFEKDYYKNIREFLKYEYSHYKIYPNMNNIFDSLKYASYEDIKVVIIGQDPYHEEGQAHGLSFSVQPGIAIPPSLQNIYKELHDDLGCYVPNNGYLVKWAKQGVLLLNNVLTVRAGLANSHKDKGWEEFTDSIIRILNKREKPIVFMFWGACAKTKEKLVTNPNHFILKTVHPSPLSVYRGFFGCKHFSKANELLKQSGEEPIDWQIENI
ncbi:MAG: uracil-DNA glycosylase [Clostridia bacterium]|nr:uracil-DNA glycosylase [Clostridia bacterium]